MTNFIEEQLAAGMRERVDGVTVAADLVDRTLHGHRRRTLITRTACVVGTVGLAGALAAGVLATVDTGPPAPGRSAVAGAEAPRMRLAAAVAASRGISYQVKNTIRPRDGKNPPMFVEGAFDPATATGYLRVPFDDGGRHEERLIGGDLYTGDAVGGQPVMWQHDEGRHTGLTYDLKTSVLGVSADPQELLASLDRADATVTQAGPDRYHFRLALPPRKGYAGATVTATVTGDVTVGPDQRIAKVTYSTAFNDRDVLDATLELYGYGRPVTVERPEGTFENLPGKPARPSTPAK